MLLEKKPSFLKQCFTDAKLLNSAVDKARSTYLKSLEMISVSSLLENTEREEEVVEESEVEGGDHSSTGAPNNHLNDLGNIVFSQVVMWYPKLADKITGKKFIHLLLLFLHMTILLDFFESFFFYTSSGQWFFSLESEWQQVS